MSEISTFLTRHHTVSIVKVNASWGDNSCVTASAVTNLTFTTNPDSYPCEEMEFKLAGGVKPYTLTIVNPYVSINLGITVKQADAGFKRWSQRAEPDRDHQRYTPSWCKTLHQVTPPTQVNKPTGGNKYGFDSHPS